MTEPPPEPRPYHVVFTRRNSVRRQTIEITDAGAAHRQAREIADAGGRAEVRYAAGGSAPQTLATYP